MENALRKKNNRRKIFKLLFENKYLSNLELSEKLGKSISFTTSIISEFLEENIIEEAGLAVSSGGRKPTVYRLVTDAFFILSIAMDQFSIRIALLDLGNNPIFPVETHMVNLANEKNIEEKLYKLLLLYVESSGIQKDKILGVGIALPGFIDSKNGISYSFFTHLPDATTLVEYLSLQLEIPVHIDNDSSLIALAENRFGLAKGFKNTMVVNFGWGIGLGIISDGSLYRGEDGFAGEFSHIPIFNNNKICSCGKIGCLETETSFSFMIEKIKNEIDNGKPSSLVGKLDEKDNTINIERFLKAVDNGDLLALEVLSEAAYNIGRGIAILVHIFNPKKIIISGRGALVGNILLPPIQQAINEHCIKRLSSNITIEVSHMKQNAELIGAACLVIDRAAELQTI